jgi:hypothetical protein
MLRMGLLRCMSPFMCRFLDAGEYNGNHALESAGESATDQDFYLWRSLADRRTREQTYSNLIGLHINAGSLLKA